MDASKDYYQTLGVTSSADSAVIKAVYKALALKYHPDRNKEHSSEAVNRMAELNEAYTILSDSSKRQTYDKLRRGNSEQDNFTDESEGYSQQFNDVGNQIKSDWALANKYFPDLDGIVERLSKISKSLVLPFKLMLIESQDFERRHDVADQMIQAYLNNYFGSNDKIVHFAMLLLNNNERDAARELNKVIRVFGKKIDPERVISQIRRDFKIDQVNVNSEKVELNSGFSFIDISFSLIFFVATIILLFVATS